MHVLFKEGYADREYLGQYTDAPAELEAPRGTARSSAGSCYHGSQRRRDRRVRTPVRKDTAEFLTDGLRLVPKSKWRIERAHAVSCLPAITGAGNTWAEARFTATDWYTASTKASSWGSIGWTRAFVRWTCRELAPCVRRPISKVGLPLKRCSSKTPIRL